MKAKSERYDVIIISGSVDSNVGTVERLARPLTLTGIKRRMTQEECGGDRWCLAYIPGGEDWEGLPSWTEVDGHDARTITDSDIDIDHRED